MVHAIPAPYAAQITLTQPPEPGEEQALKLFFSVPSLAQARSLAAAHGGSVDARIWQGPGFDAANAIDPERNILQVREWRF